MVITSHLPGWATLSPDRAAAHVQLPGIYAKSEGASGSKEPHSLRALSRSCRDVKAKPCTPPKASPCHQHSQHKVYLPKLLPRRHQEPEPAPPPSPACWEGFATCSIISSLSGFNGQLSTQLLPARIIYSIKRHFSLCPCLHTVIKLPPAYQSLGYPRQSFIS